VCPEFQTVGRIQRSLLPSDLPRIPTLALAADYVTSTRAGGDYYDLFSLGKGKWGFLVADVSGHGTPAAVVMAITHALAHVFPETPASPSALLQYLNRPLARFYSADGGFVTAFYGVYDESSRAFTYAAAGHPPPRLRRGSTGQIAALDAVRGMPLGVTEEPTGPGGGYEDATIILAPADVLLLHTDGITEARRPGGELFGTARLDDILRSWRGSEPATLIANINAKLEEFTSGLAPSDDRTLFIALAR
jgi:sigma-B regulation protein RsbU (phosphoserine phosphatase)